MSKLYDIVNKTINAKSMSEAEQILFGSDGIVINSKEYYENIISNFVKKKETVIRKTVDSNGKTQLVFDLNNCNDMWNILFIYNYYINYLDNRITDLNQQINDCNRIKNALLTQKRELNKDDSRYNEISKQWQDKETERKNLDNLKSYFIQLKNKSLSVNAVKLENIERIDEIKLKQYLDKLKEAINCIQKIRDSLEHRNSNFNIDNNILNIDNKLGKFEISIPVEYLDGFNKGRIIANDEDHVIVERTNEISSPLLKALDFDIKKIDSFFYNVEPSYLEFILEKVNYDVNELYKLSTNIFNYKRVVKKFINMGIDIFFISRLPFEVFINADEFIELLKLLKLKKINFNNLSTAAFKYASNSIELLNEGIDISKLLPCFFSNLHDTIKIYRSNLKIKEEMELLPEGLLQNIPELYKIFEINEKLPMLYTDSKEIIELIKLLELKGIDISELPYEAFLNWHNTLELLNEGIDISKLSPAGFLNTKKVIEIRKKIKQKEKNISQLSSNYSLDPQIIIKFKKILELKGIDISKLSPAAFYYWDNTIEFINEGIDITKLPSEAYYNLDRTISLINEGIDITKLPKNFLYRWQREYYLKIKNLKKILAKVNYEQLDILPFEFFQCNVYLIDKMFMKYNSNISRSIFGIKNPKIIAALVYANSVLSNYNDKTISTIDMDIKPYSIICDTYIDNYKYRNNIEENIAREYNSSEFVEQFKLFDEDDLDRSTDDIKKTILNKFRNACAHFRFKLVKDKDGNIIQDKIYIYDEDNNGINNFNLIIDLNEFVSIVREAEIHIGKQKNNVEESIKKSR